MHIRAFFKKIKISLLVIFVFIIGCGDYNKEDYRGTKKLDIIAMRNTGSLILKLSQLTWQQKTILPDIDMDIEIYDITGSGP